MSTNSVGVPLSASTSASPPAGAPPSTAPGLGAAIFWIASGLGLMLAAYLFGVHFADGLGASASNARLALAAAFAVGAANTLLFGWRARRWIGRMHQGLAAALELATEGAGAAEVLDHSEAQAESDRAEFRASISESANFQVLLGMLLTAVWLASQAPLFQAAADALAADASSAMAPIVAGLLQLGPKAFMATAAAVSTALVILLVGYAIYGSLSHRGPQRAAYLKAWREGHRIWEQHEFAILQQRTTNMVAQAFTIEQVKNTQNEFQTAMKQMAGLLESANTSLKGFQDAAELITASNTKLAEVTNSLDTAQIHVNEVATALAALSAQVRTYGQNLLVGTEHFTAQLIKDTSQRIPEVVSSATAATVTAFQPHFHQLAQEVHRELDRSARILQQRYTDSFSENLLLAEATLQHVAELSGQLENRAQRLEGDLRRSANGWVQASTKLVEVTDAVATSFAQAAGQGGLAARNTESAREALVLAAQDAAQATQELKRLVRSANHELGAIRREAETLGRIKEVVGAPPNGRVRT